MSSTTQNTSNVLPNGKRIPRRQSARKVKFIFSDQDSEEEEKTSRRKKRIKQSNDQPPICLTTNSIKPTTTQLLPRIQQSVASTHQNLESEDSDEEYFQQLLRKNMPQAQTDPLNSIPNAIQLAQHHFIQNQLLIETLTNTQDINSFNTRSTQSIKARHLVKKTLTTQKPIESITARSKKKGLKKTKRSVAQRTKQVLSTKKFYFEAKPEKLVFKFKAAPESSFSKEELIKSTLPEKHQILNNQPVVRMEHSKPFPIALVESQTNIVETKAVLFMHLFQSLSSPCIGCPECSDFMTCRDFSKHIHIDEDDDVGLAELKKSNTQKSYKILPYRMNEDEELSENDMNIWRQFGRRCAQFKQDKQKAQTESEKTILVTKDMNNNDVVPIVDMNLAESSNISVMNMLQFEEWDSMENESFLISRERFECDQICTVKYEEACEENVHYFMEEKEDLLLSEDESEVSHLNSIFQKKFNDKS